MMLFRGGALPLIAGTVLVLLSGCGPSPTTAAVAQLDARGQMDPRAVDICEQNGAVSLTSATDGTVADVRELASKSPVKAGWDRGLPRSNKTYAAICISDTSEIPGVGDDFERMATWASVDDETGGSGLLVLW